MGSLDHDMVGVNRRGKLLNFEEKFKIKQIWKDYTPQLLNNSLNFSNWTPMYHTTNIDMMVDIFTNNKIEVLDMIALIKKISSKMKFKFFISRESN